MARLTKRYLSRKKAETLLMDHISPTVIKGELAIQVTFGLPLLENK